MWYPDEVEHMAAFSELLSSWARHWVSPRWNEGRLLGRVHSHPNSDPPEWLMRREDNHAHEASVFDPKPEATGEPVGQFDATPYAPLLEDDEIRLWALETAARHDLSTLDAIGLLAEALILDGAR